MRGRDPPHGCISRSPEFFVFLVTNANAPCFPRYDQSEETPEAAVVVPGPVNHALAPSSEFFCTWHRPRSITGLLVRCTFSTRLYRSMTSSGVRASSSSGVCDEKGRHRQLGTSTNTADRIQTCSGGFERNDGTKKWYVSTVLKLWSWWKRPSHGCHAHVKNIPS